MRLQQLDENERAVLVAALRLSVISDGRGSAGEAAWIAVISEDLGDRAFRQADDVAEKLAPNLEAFKGILATVTRKEAQELIFGTVIDAVEPDGIDDGEDDLLTAMAEAWDIHPTFDAPELLEGDEEE